MNMLLQGVIMLIKHMLCVTNGIILRSQNKPRRGCDEIILVMYETNPRAVHKEIDSELI